MPEPTTESADKQIDRFIDHFEAFDARLVARPNLPLYLPISNRIALFAIYWNQGD